MNEKLHFGKNQIFYIIWPETRSASNERDSGATLNVYFFQSFRLN